MAVIAKIRAAGQALEIGAHVAWERASRPTPRTAADVPVSVEAITTDWLTAVLCAEHPGAEVVAFELGGLSKGTTTRKSITATYNDAGRAARLPEHLFAKTSSQLTSRLIVGLSGALDNEAGFYEHIRPGLELCAPHGYHLGHRAGAFTSVFLIEDVGVTRGARFLHADVHVDRAMASAQVRQLAALHGAFWGGERVARDFPWVPTSLAFQERFNDIANFEKRTDLGMARFPQLIPDALMDRRPDVWPATMRSLQDNVKGPVTLLHHDVHIGNWFQESGGELGLYDWQATVRGGYACDLAYALAAGLRTENRRAWEEELVREYLDALPLRAALVPSFDDAWLAYRRQQFHGLIYWLFTIAQGRFQPAMQPHDLTSIIVRRTAQAVVDLGSLEAI